MCLTVVGHPVGHIGGELALMEHIDHLVDHVFDIIELPLDALSLFLSLFNFIDDIHLPLFQLRNLRFLLVMRHLGQLLVLDNVLIQLLVVLFNSISLLIQQINVVVQTVILVLCLDECCHDFFNVRYSTGVFDLLESLLYDLTVFTVLVNQGFLFSIDSCDFLNSTLQNSDGVGKLLRLG